VRAGAAVVLLAAEESAESHALDKLLSDQGYDVVFVHDTQAALSAIDGTHPGGLVADARGARVDGLALVKRARALRPDACAVLLAPDLGLLDEALKLGAADVLPRPVHTGKLLTILAAGFARQALARRVDQLEARLDESFGFENLAGQGEAATQLMRQARRAAETDTPYLLIGEPGTGRATLAQAIHQNSKRGHAAFVRVAKAATQEAQEEARGGTLYLESLEGVDLAPLLANKTFRVLAAATPDATESVRAPFEQSEIRILPLRERIEDLPLLVDKFLKEFNREHGRRVNGVTRGALEQLSTYEWPGNVRELRSAIEGMVVFAEGRRPLDVSDLPHDARVATRPGRGALTLPMEMSLAEVEKRFIQATLLAMRYDRPRAAAAMGIGLRTLYRKLKEYEIG
jgi:two-component system response regulator HydG